MHLLEKLEDRTLLSFTTISDPTTAYTNGTIDLAAAIPANGTTVVTLADPNQTLTFSPSVLAGTVPVTFGTWNSPPAVESALPRTLEKAGTTSLAINLSHPASTFGVEAEPFLFGSHTITASFYQNATLVGTVVRAVEGDSGALLFAASTDQAFTSVVLTADAATGGFGLAQPRYALAPADLAITQTVSAAQALAGDTLTYTITVTNNGPGDAFSPQVLDTLPSSLDFASFSFGTTQVGWDGVFNFGPGTLQYTAPTIAAGATATFTYSVAVDSAASPGTKIDNTATVSSSTTDPDPSNNSSTATTVVISRYVYIYGTGQDDQFLIVNNPTVTGAVDFYVNGSLEQTQQADTIVQAFVYGWEGNDMLTVSSANGLVLFSGTDPLLGPQPHYIFYDGNEGFNSLYITNTVNPRPTFGPALSAPVNPGETIIAGSVPGTGVDVVKSEADTQTVNFTNLAPIYTDIPQPTLAIQPGPGASVLNASNAINYGLGAAPAAPDTPDPGWGRVTIDGWEPINFTNKASLVLNSGAGDDVININGPQGGSPGGPVGPEQAPALLTAITIDGGDPNASDTLIYTTYSAVTAVLPTAQGAGSIVVDSADPPLTYQNIERLQIDGSQFPGAGLDIEGTPNNDSVTFTPGATSQTGTVTGTMNLRNLDPPSIPFTLPTITYSGFVPSSTSAFGAINYDMAQPQPSGGSDTVTFNTPAGSTMSIGTISSERITVYVGGQLYSTLDVGGITQLNVNLASGGANTVVVGANQFTPLTYNVGVTGSDPATNSLVYWADFESQTVINLTQQTIDGPNMGDVRYAGVGSIELTANNGGLSFLSDRAVDLRYTPTGVGSGTLTAGPGSPRFTFSSVAATSPGVALDPAAGGTVAVVSTVGLDAITAELQAVNAANVPVVTVNTLLPAVVASPDTAWLYIDGLDGLDVLTVDSTLGAFPIPISFDGGLGANSLVLQGGTATLDVYSPGPGVGEGASTIIIGGVTQVVLFKNLKPVLDIVAGPLLVGGTDSNDTINYSAGTLIGNGLVTVNHFESIEFANKTALTLDGAGGDDIFTINNVTTPTNLAAISVTGGPGNDTLVVDANSRPVLSTYVTASAVNIPGATPVPVGYDAGVEDVRIIHAQVGYSSAALTIAGTERIGMVDVPVASFNFSDPAIPIVLGRESDFAATINWGDGATGPGTVKGTSGGGFTVLGSHTYGAGGTYAVTTTITDLGSTRSFTVTSAPPNARTVPVTIEDNAGTVFTISPAVNNAAIGTGLLSAEGVPVNGVEGVPLTTILPPSADVLVASVQDTGTVLGVAAYAASINWGDGTAGTATRITVAGTPQGAVFSVFGTHTYAEAGTYTVIVTVTKTEGTAPNTVTSVDIASSSAFIADAVLAISGVQPVISTIEAGRFPVPVFAPPLFSGPVASFTNGSLTALASDFEAQIDWGDGTPRTDGLVTQPGGVGTAFIVIGRHTYADSEVNGGPGGFTVQVFIQDDEGARLIMRNTATVADRPLAPVGVLNPASDSGKFNNDAITNINQPNFYGTSEPFSDVVLYANGTYIGQAEAGSDGAWSITSNLLPDGSYMITATATDQFGVTTTPVPTLIVLSLTIDTVAPRVTYAAFDRMIGTAYFTFQDYLPDQLTPGGTGTLVQTLQDSANFSLNRVHTKPPGTYIVTDLTVTTGATAASNDVTAVFNNGKYMKGGYFQLIARARSALLVSGIQDRAGNALDGEFYGQASASGNGVAGGDFIANIKSIHQNTPGYGYSGALTILGYPHPNDPPPKVPPIKKTPTRGTTTPIAKRPTLVKVTSPKTPVTTKTPSSGTSTGTASSTSTMSMGAWLNIRQRLLKNAASSRGLG